MKFGEKIGEKIEKFYLEILRWILLIAATVSLLVFFVGLIWSGIYYFSNPPNKPNKEKEFKKKAFEKKLIRSCLMWYNKNLLDKLLKLKINEALTFLLFVDTIRLSSLK